MNPTHRPRTSATLVLAAASLFTFATGRPATAAPPSDCLAFSWMAQPDPWRAAWLPEEAAAMGRFSGVWISLDPVTRRPVPPTPEQRAGALQQAPGRDEVLPEERIPGGGALVHLNGRHIVFSVARRDASGRLTTGCADPADAARLLASPAPAKPAREAK